MKQETWGGTCIFHTRHGAVPPTTSTKHGSFERLFRHKMSQKGPYDTCLKFGPWLLKVVQKTSYRPCDMGHAPFDTNHVHLSIDNFFIMTW